MYIVTFFAVLVWAFIKTLKRAENIEGCCGKSMPWSERCSFFLGRFLVTLALVWVLETALYVGLTLGL